MGFSMFRAAIFALVWLTVSLGTGTANAFQDAGHRLGQPRSEIMPVEARTMAPLSFVQFCMVYGQECAAQGEPDALIRLTPEVLAQIERVNREVNRSIRPVSKAGDALEAWRIAPASGDCNDFAVTKRHRLVALGLPSSALLLATAMTTWGEGHLLVVLRTEEGDLVLDNLVETIRPWNSTGYRWLARQSSQHPRHWEAVAQGRERTRFAAKVEQAKMRAAERQARLRDEYRQRLAVAARARDEVAEAPLQRSAPPIAFVKLSLGWEGLAPRGDAVVPVQPDPRQALAMPAMLALNSEAALSDGLPVFWRMAGWAGLAPMVSFA